MCALKMEVAYITTGLGRHRRHRWSYVNYAFHMVNEWREQPASMETRIEAPPRMRRAVFRRVLRVNGISVGSAQ